MRIQFSKESFDAFQFLIGKGKIEDTRMKKQRFRFISC